MDALRAAVRDAVRCHFNEDDRLKAIRLHLVRKERLARQRRAREAELAQRRGAARATLERIWAVPVLDERSPDEIIGYDEYVPS